MAGKSSVVSNHWNVYQRLHKDMRMMVSFDEDVARGEQSAELSLCARIMIPTAVKNAAGEFDRLSFDVLNGLEDHLVESLQQDNIHCRLVGRLTYGGLRELVFQLQDWESFRPTVGMWMREHAEHEIDVSEHEGWNFFHDFLMPGVEDRLQMADRSVIDNLIKHGSDPKQIHALEFAFRADVYQYQTMLPELLSRGYEASSEKSSEGQLFVLIKRMPLDYAKVTEESVANHRLAKQVGAECDGWGALIVGK